MSRFSLSRGESALFPVSVRVAGRNCGIDADFRTILKIFRLLDDETVVNRHKYKLLCRFFYNGEGGFPGLTDGVRGFTEFIRRGAPFGGFGDNSADSGENLVDNGENGVEKAEKQFDFEFDSVEIFQSFFSEYGIDLTNTGFLHFYKFLLLLSGLSRESALNRKLSARFMDLSGLKGKELARAREMKEWARLPVRYSKEELKELEEFNSVWGRF